MRLNILVTMIGMLMTTICAETKLITHAPTAQFDLTATQNRLKDQPQLTLSLKETLNLLDQLTQFEAGRFLLQNQGLNGYWTSYLIVYGPKKQNLPPLEHWILHEAPVVKATQERFKIFQKIIQQRLRPSDTIASIPCGAMDDLLSLNYTATPNVHLVGIDLDPQSLTLAQVNAVTIGYTDAVFLQKNAWELDVQNTYALITSNGLNIYEPDDTKVIQLYQSFYKALKSTGILVTSFLTPPPALSKESTWKNLNTEALKKQKAIFADIIQVKWQVFRTEAQTRAHLEHAGFKIVEVFYDSQGMFPTIIAEKP